MLNDMIVVNYKNYVFYIALCKINIVNKTGLQDMLTAFTSFSWVIYCLLKS